MAQPTPAPVQTFKHTANWDEFTKEYGKLITDAEKESEIPSGMLGRLLWQESRGNTKAVSPKGAKGPAQFMADTAAEMGLKDSEDPRVAIPAAGKYLRKIKDQYLKTGDWDQVVASYNMGHAAVSKNWPYSIGPETRQYVRLVAGTDPWPGRDLDKDGKRPGLDRLFNNMPVGIRPQSRLVHPEALQAGVVAQAPATPTAAIPGDFAGPRSEGLADIPKSTTVPIKSYPRELQANVYFSEEDQQANLKEQRRAGELTQATEASNLTFSDKYDAAVRLNHVIPSINAAREINIAAHLYGPSDWVVKPESAVEDLTSLGISAEYATRLMEARGPKHYSAILGTIKQEADADRVMSSVGFLPALGYGALSGLSDPTMAALNFTSLGAPAWLRSGGMGARVAKGGLYGVGVAGAAELPLQLTQQTRTIDDALYTLAGSTVLGGLTLAPGGRELKKFSETMRVVRDKVQAGEAVLPKHDAEIHPVTIGIPGDPVVRPNPVLRNPEPGKITKPVEPKVDHLASVYESPSPRAIQTDTGFSMGPSPIAAGSVTLPPAEPVMGVSFVMPERLTIGEVALSKPDSAANTGVVRTMGTGDIKLLVEMDTAEAIRFAGVPKKSKKLLEKAPKDSADPAGPVKLPDGTGDPGSVKIPDDDEIPEEAFLPGSVGAAQIKTIDGVDLPYRSTVTPSAWGAWWLRFDPAGRMRNLKNTVTGWYSNMLEDGVGLGSKGEAMAESVEELAERQRVTRETSALTGLEQVFSKLDQGNSTWGKATRRLEFERKLLDFYETGAGLNGHPNSAVWQEGVAILDGFFNDYREWLQKSGVKYAEGLNSNQHYLPHVIHVGKFREMIDKVGMQQVKKLLSGSMEAKYLQANGMAAGKGLRTAFDALAGGYVEGVVRRGHWGDLIGLHGLSNDRPSLRALVEESVGRGSHATPETMKTQVDAIMEIIDSMGSGGSGPERFKHRFDFDMGHSRVVRNFSGTNEAIKMSDLYVREATSLIQMYGRQVAGHAALAQKMGIKSRADHEMWKLKAQEVHQGSDKDLRKALQLMDYAYDGITGKPFEDDPMSAFNVWGRRLRDFNFIRLMGQVGFAQIAEFGRAVSVAGWKAMAQQMPVITEVFARAKDGKLDNQLLREIEAMTGVGTHRFRSMLHSASDDTIEGTTGTAIDSMLHKGKMLIADVSGMSFLTTMQQRMTGAAIAQNLVNRALKGSMDDKLIRSLGLAPEDWAFVAQEIKANTTVGTGGRVHALNHADMDPEAANLLAAALMRGVRRAVQENSLGNTMPFMHRTTGQLIMQFRGFGMGAIYKQTLQGLAQRDVLTAQAFLATSMLGGLSYMVQTYLNEPDPDKLSEKLQWDRVAKAGFNRSGYMSMIPAVVDSTVNWGSGGTVPGFFNGRTTQGLGADFVSGVPTVNLLSNAQRAASSLPNAALRDDYDFSKADARAWTSILPGANAIGIRRALSFLSEDLPRESSDSAQDYFSSK